MCKVLNDLKNSGKNFITKNGNNVLYHCNFSSKTNNKRRFRQYIAGEIITIFSGPELNKLLNTDVKREHFDNLKCLMLVIGNPTGQNYLICPIYQRPILSFQETNQKEVVLGVIEAINRFKLLVADISHCHFVDKKELHSFITEQRAFLYENFNYNIRNIKLDLNRLNLVREKAKLFLFN